MAHSQDEPAWQKTLRGRSMTTFNAVGRSEAKEKSLQLEKPRLRQSDPREHDGPAVTAMRTELRNLERGGRNQPKLTLHPKDVTSGGRETAARMQRELELRRELHKVDKARENFNDRAQPSKTRDDFNDRAKRDR